jgi:PAS domain-containing protein
MPICPRCGKCLSSEQALTYHLNRKYRCGIWNCVKCTENFNTKFQMQIHEMSCIGDRAVYHTQPPTDVLLTVYESIPAMIIEYDPHNNGVLRVSPQCESLFGLHSEELIGKKLNQLKEQYQWKQAVAMRPNLVCVMAS